MENFTRNIVGHLKKNTNGASTAKPLAKNYRERSTTLL